MDTICMNSKNSKTSYSHRLLLNLYKERINMLLYQILAYILCVEKYKKVMQKQ